MKLDYNQYVDQLPATGYTSDGKLLWQPRWSDTNYWSFSFRVLVVKFNILALPMGNIVTTVQTS